ncbi:MAG TPA: hypothetical protein VM260_28285 [Pirellula sp.]|nr:hypothetical protein [Pirellula sp.]
MQSERSDAPMDGEHVYFSALNAELHTNMVKVLDTTNFPKRKRLAVILPKEYRGGTVRLMVSLLRYFQQESDFELVIGMPTGHRANIQHQLSSLAQHSNAISYREFTWETIPLEQAKAYLRNHGIEIDHFVSKEYCLLADSGDHFLDCDFWFFISDRIELPLLPLKPYGILVTDHLQRYVPSIFESIAYESRDSILVNYLRNVRNADLAVATSSATLADLISYSGVRGELVRLPTFIDGEYFQSLQKAEKSQCKFVPNCPYFVWVTNTAMHKNHLRAIETLASYYECSEEPIDVVVTGVDTDLFSPQLSEIAKGGREGILRLPYIQEVRALIQDRLGPWLSRIRFAGEVSDEDYCSILTSAKFLWHNVIADNGTFSVIEAAFLGTPSVTSDYPQMRELNESIGLSMEFFDPYCHHSATLAIQKAAVSSRINMARTEKNVGRFHFSNWGSQLSDAIIKCQNSPRRRIECI